MKLTDEKVIKMVKDADLWYLEEDIKTYPEDEVEGIPDIVFVHEEVEYILSLYEDDGNTLYDELRYAKKLLRETKNGTLIPISTKTFRPLDGYAPHNIEEAKSIVDEYKRFKKLHRKLENALVKYCTDVLGMEVG